MYLTLHNPADLRQGYFLGKLVKKAARGIKKIIKSPIGKAVLLNYAPTLFGGDTMLKSFMDLDFMKKNKFGGKLFNKLFMEKTDDGYSGIDPFKIGILGASALTGLMAKRDQDDEVSLDEYMRTASRGPGMDPRGIRIQTI